MGTLESAGPGHAPRRAARSRRDADPASVQQPTGELQRLQTAVGNRGMQQLLGVRGLIGEGAPLPDGLRTEAEARFGTDLRDVRVHDHAASHALAQRQLARAFTLGSDIVFNKGRYQAGSSEGRHLLRHELAHVVQQTRGGAGVPSGRAHEDAADQAAAAFARGAAGPIDAGPSAAIGVQCTPLSAAEIEALELPRVRARLAENEEESRSTVGSAEYNARLAQENLLLKDRAMALMQVGVPGSQASSSVARPPTKSVDKGTSHVESITNEELISAMSMEPGRSSSVLERERRRRVGMGHKWLEEAWDVAPSRLIQILPKSPATEVVEADMATALGAAVDVRSRPILSPQQFAAFLASHGIPSMTPKEYLAARAGRIGALGALGGDAHLQGIQLAEARAFSRSPGTTWMGQRAEFGQMSHPLFGDLLHYDFNNRGWVDTRGGANVLHLARERNFPIVDLRSRSTGNLQSLKTSVQKPSGRYPYFGEGLGDLTGGSRPDLFATMLQNLTAGQANTAADFLSKAQLLIPPDDVAALQALLSNPTAPMTPEGRLPLYRLQSFCPIFDGLLAADPVRLSVGLPQYNSVAALDAAVAAHDITQAQMDVVLQQRGQRAASMVAGHNESVTDLRGDVNLRNRTGSPAGTQMIAGPEYLAATRYGKQYGSWGAGVSVGAVGAAPRGGLAGAVIAVITDTGVMLFDGRDNPEAIERLQHSAGYGFLGGTVGAGTEFAVQAQIQRQLVRQTLTSGAPTAVRAGVMKGAGGAVGGGVASIAVETWQIATEEGPHSGSEVALRESRALVIGATSGFLATVAGSAATGFVAGTAVPGAGNAVGLVVGLLVGVGVAVAMEMAIPRPERTRE